MKKIILPNETGSIEKAQNYIREVLQTYGVENRTITRALLASEEVLAKTINSSHKEHENQLIVSISKLFGEIEIHIRGYGEPFEASDIMESFAYEDDPEIQSVIASLTEKVLGGRVVVRHTRGQNHTVITVEKSAHKQLYLTIGGLLLGIIVGLMIRTMLPSGLQEVLINNIFSSVSTMFLNAIKVIVAPLVFFSIATSVSEFHDLKALGRIGGKVIAFYCVTSLIAIFVGLLIYHFIPIGNPALQAAVTNAAASVVEKGAGVTVSIRELIVNIIPENMIKPILNADMLQIIFLAVMIGLASSKIGEYSDSCRKGLAVLNALFSKVTAMIIGFMPLAVFCSMAKMVIKIDMSIFLSVLAWPLTIYVADFVMLTVYGVILFVVARLNPVTFFKKYKGVMLTAYSLSSSNATMPFSMEACDKKLGIHPKVYSFSIPLGATINMDGSCITLIISSLFMAKIYGIPVGASILFSICLSIFILSVGAPGVPGGALVCLSMLLPQIGVPTEAISIVMGLYSLVGMMQTCTNVTGDAVVTTVVAKSEGMLDPPIYNSYK